MKEIGGACTLDVEDWVNPLMGIFGSHAGPLSRYPSLNTCIDGCFSLHLGFKVRCLEPWVTKICPTFSGGWLMCPKGKLCCRILLAVSVMANPSPHRPCLMVNFLELWTQAAGDLAEELMLWFWGFEGIFPV